MRAMMMGDTPLVDLSDEQLTEFRRARHGNVQYSPADCDKEVDRRAMARNTTALQRHSRLMILLTFVSAIAAMASAVSAYLGYLRL